MNLKSIFSSIFEFHFVSLLGIGMALWLYHIQSETTPLSAFLFSSHIYLIAFLIVVACRVISWVVLDTATFYNIRSRLLGIISDYILFVMALLGTLGCLFLFNVFF